VALLAIEDQKAVFMDELKKTGVPDHPLKRGKRAADVDDVEVMIKITSMRIIIIGAIVIIIMTVIIRIIIIIMIIMIIIINKK
jgi:hypothetical protein